MGIGRQVLHVSWALMLLFFCLNLVCTGELYCNYEIQNLEMGGVSPTDKEIFSTMDIGTSVFTVILQEAEFAMKREISESMEYNILMVTNSSNYELIFVDDYMYYEVVVKNCLQAGHRENLEFSLNYQMLRGSECGVWTLETYVEPSKPNFTIPRSVTVSVSSCLADVDVLDLQFHNGGNCSSWSCSVHSNNDEEMFWVEGRTVRTSRDKINFGLTYGIRVRCFDDTADGELVDETTGDAMISVSFVDAAGPCTDSPVSITTSLSTTSSHGVVEQGSTVLVQTTGNVATVWSSSIIMVGIPIGIAIYT